MSGRSIKRSGDVVLSLLFGAGELACAVREQHQSYRFENLKVLQGQGSLGQDACDVAERVDDHQAEGHPVEQKTEDAQDVVSGDFHKEPHAVLYRVRPSYLRKVLVQGVLTPNLYFVLDLDGSGETEVVDIRARYGDRAWHERFISLWLKTLSYATLPPCNEDYEGL